MDVNEVIILKTKSKSLKNSETYLEFKDNDNIDVSRYKNTKIHVKRKIPLNF